VQFYGTLLRELCGAAGGTDHGYTLRFAYWDLLAAADTMSKRKLEHAARMLAVRRIHSTHPRSPRC
jgi:hypothetical protein